MGANLLVSAFAGALISIASSLVGRVLLALGMGFATYTGINATLTYITGQFASYIGSTGAMVAGLAGVLKLDVGFAVLIAAVTARFLLDGISGGTFKKLVIK